MESLLASAAIPNLFPAVWVDGHAYWDGIFSSNPPVVGFLRKPLMGKSALPEEIWIISGQSARSTTTVPEKPSDIFDRRNHLAGNLSLQHELQMIEMVNMLIQEGALTDHFRARFGLDTDRADHGALHPDVRRAAAGPGLSEQALAPAAHIARLIADGEAQADAFLAELGETRSPGRSSTVERLPPLSALSRRSQRGTLPAARRPRADLARPSCESERTSAPDRPKLGRDARCPARC